MLSRIETYKILRIVAFVVALGLSYIASAQTVFSVNPGMSPAQIQTAITNAGAATPRGIVEFQAGTYYVGHPNDWVAGGVFTVPAGVTIRGVGNVEIILTQGERLFDVIGSTNPNEITRIENIRMRDNTTSTRWPGLPRNGGGLISAVSISPNIVRLDIENSYLMGGRIGGVGGAIHAVGAELTIRNSTITGSNGVEGGAFELVNSTTRIYNSNIGNNGGSAPVQTATGGAFRVNGGSLHVQGSQLFNNSVGGGGGRGGAIFMMGGSYVTLYRTDIVNNTVTAGAGGSGFYLADPTPVGYNGNILNLNFTTISHNTSEIGWASAGAIRVGPRPNEVNISNSIVAGNVNAGTGGDDVPVDDPNINIENSVVGEDYVVSNDPEHECYSVPCGVDPPYGYTRCIHCDVFTPDDIYVYPDGSTRPPVIDVPGVDVGSGGDDAENRPSLTLQIFPYPRIICPTDTIRFSLSQRNLQGQIQLIRVDSINHIPTDTVGRQIATRNATNDIANIYLPVPESTIPVLFFRARGQSQGGNNPVVWSSTVHMVVLPQATPRRIDHVSNIPE